jgi:hypothetical protein
MRLRTSVDGISLSFQGSLRELMEAVIQGHELSNMEAGRHGLGKDDVLDRVLDS